MKSEFHIMFNLSCFLIMGTDFMKSYDIIFKWGKKGDSNVIMIQDRHHVKIKTIKNSSAHFRKIDNSALINIAAKLSMKVKTLKASKRRQVNVYAERIRVIEKNQKQNVSLIHKSLVLNNYIFESIQRRDLVIGSYLLDVNAMVQSDWNSISMTNFEKVSIKINKNQFFDRLVSFKERNNSITINYNYADVFFGKVNFICEIEISINCDNFKIENVIKLSENANSFFDKIVSVSETKDSINPFIIKTSESKKMKDSNVNDH